MEALQLKGIWLDTPTIQVCREHDGLFEIWLKSQNTLTYATESETHHFARVMVALKQLGISEYSRSTKKAVEDFAAAVVGHKNYYIRRMYFSTQPETIAKWYHKPAIV